METIPSIIPMFHGSSEKPVSQILQQGFATVATLDAGWYGQGIYIVFHSQLTNKGIYFTSCMEYAKYFSFLQRVTNPLSL